MTRGRNSLLGGLPSLKWMANKDDNPTRILIVIAKKNYCLFCHKYHHLPSSSLLKKTCCLFAFFCHKYDDLASSMWMANKDDNKTRFTGTLIIIITTNINIIITLIGLLLGNHHFSEEIFELKLHFLLQKPPSGTRSSSRPQKIQFVFLGFQTPGNPRHVLEKLQQCLFTSG